MTKQAQQINLQPQSTTTHKKQNVMSNVNDVKATASNILTIISERTPDKLRKDGKSVMALLWRRRNHLRLSGREQVSHSAILTENAPPSPSQLLCQCCILDKCLGRGRRREEKNGAKIVAGQQAQLDAMDY